MPDPCANRILSNSHGQLVAVDGKLAVGAACCGPAAPCNSVIFTPTVAHFICNGTVPVLLPCILIPLVKFGVGVTYSQVPDLINLEGICYSKTACVQYVEDEAGTPPPFTCNGRLIYVYKTDQDIPYVALLTPTQIAAAECGVSKRVGIVAIKCDGFRLTENGLVSLWCPPVSCKFRSAGFDNGLQVCFSVNHDGPWRVRNPTTDTPFHAASELDALPAIDDCCSCTPCFKDRIDDNQPELGKCCCGTGNCDTRTLGFIENIVTIPYAGLPDQRVYMRVDFDFTGDLSGVTGFSVTRTETTGGPPDNRQPLTVYPPEFNVIPWGGKCFPTAYRPNGWFNSPDGGPLVESLTFTCTSLVLTLTGTINYPNGETFTTAGRSESTVDCDTENCGRYAGCSGAIVAVTGSIEGAV